MSKRYHITPDGPKPCTAKTKSCPYGNHYTDIEEAQKAMDTIHEMEELCLEVDYSKPLEETDGYKEYTAGVAEMKGVMAEYDRKNKAFNDIKDVIDKSLKPDENGNINGGKASLKLGNLFHDINNKKPTDITKEQWDELAEHTLETLAPYSRKAIVDANEVLAKEVGTDPDKAVELVLNDLSDLYEKLNETERKAKGIFKLRKFLYKQEYEETQALYKERKAQLSNYRKMINDKVNYGASIENKVMIWHSSTRKNYFEEYDTHVMENKDISPLWSTKINYRQGYQIRLSSVCGSIYDEDSIFVDKLLDKEFPDFKDL